MPLSFKMNSEKTQFHLNDNKVFPFVFKICLATIGVAFFGAQLRLRTFFRETVDMRKLIYAKKYDILADNDSECRQEPLMREAFIHAAKAITEFMELDTKIMEDDRIICVQLSIPMALLFGESKEKLILLFSMSDAIFFKRNEMYAVEMELHLNIGE